MNPNITRRERGWPGHFFGARNCMFRRNTLVSDEVQNRHIVVSTVGMWWPRDVVEPIGLNRFYETMCFLGSAQGPCIDATGNQIYIGDEAWGIFADDAAGLSSDSDICADAMHEGNVGAVMRDFDGIYERAVARGAAP